MHALDAVSDVSWRHCCTAGALKVAAKAPKGSVILCMLADTSERYLSTPLYADIAVDMDEHELKIAMSTPSMQLIPNKEPVL
jgi:hypothetical protein